MSAAISPATQRPYGVQRVCRIWAVPRSTFYRTSNPANAAPARPRGPRPPVDDESLLAAIRTDLAASPFSGEGHRKIRARLHHMIECLMDQGDQHSRCGGPAAAPTSCSTSAGNSPPGLQRGSSAHRPARSSPAQARS